MGQIKALLRGGMQEAVSEKMRKVSKEIISCPQFNEYVLVGGTNLAIRLNHRVSIDLDFFRPEGELSLERNQFIAKALNELFRTDRVEIVNLSDVGVFAFVDDVKVDLVQHPYALIDEIQVIDEFRMASIKDIAAMKISAVAGRGLRKDFYDIQRLLQEFRLDEMLEYYREKHEVDNLQHAIMSLTYFDDAENPEARNNHVQSLEDITWDQVKARIRKAVVRYDNNN